MLDDNVPQPWRARAGYTGGPSRLPLACKCTCDAAPATDVIFASEFLGAPAYEVARDQASLLIFVWRTLTFEPHRN